jgi:hypothetical protein
VPFVSIYHLNVNKGVYKMSWFEKVTPNPDHGVAQFGYECIAYPLAAPLAAVLDFLDVLGSGSMPSGGGSSDSNDNRNSGGGCHCTCESHWK